MPVFISLCTVDFGYHSGCGDGWWCWLYLRRKTAMFVQSRLQTNCLASSLALVALQKSVHAKFTPSSTDVAPLKNNMFAEIFRDTTAVALGQDRAVVHLYRCGHRDPRVIHVGGRWLPGPRETRQGREKKFPINSGNWYKLCCHTIQSPFLFYWPPSLTHVCDSRVLCF